MAIGDHFYNLPQWSSAMLFNNVSCDGGKVVITNSFSCNLYYEGRFAFLISDKFPIRCITTLLI